MKTFASSRQRRIMVDAPGAIHKGLAGNAMCENGEDGEDAVIDGRQDVSAAGAGG